MIRRLAVPPFEALDPLLPHRGGSDPATRDSVAAILEAVLARGDEAIREYTRLFDGVDLPPPKWELDPTAWQGALDRIAPALRARPHAGRGPGAGVSRASAGAGVHAREADGTVVGMKVTPLDRVGLYVPGGKASLSLSVVMNAVPAVVAGVQEIVAVVPPQGVTDVVLAACALAGVTRIFRIGGAQAVAALAYGTATVPRVDKIVGPGNRWVAEAKRQVVGQVGIDMIAGPTEVLVIADATARPARVAADLIAQAEHDEDAVSWCVTHGPGARRRACRRRWRRRWPGRRGRRSRGRALERNGLDRAGARRCARRSKWPTAARPSISRSWPRAPSASRAASGTRAPSSSATTRPSPWATTSPARATCCRPAARRATPRRSASTTS